jgi:hypothetical protein
MAIVLITNSKYLLFGSWLNIVIQNRSHIFSMDVHVSVAGFAAGLDIMYWMAGQNHCWALISIEVREKGCIGCIA